MSIDDGPLQRHDAGDLPTNVVTLQALLAIVLLVVVLPLCAPARLLRLR